MRLPFHKRKNRRVRVTDLVIRRSIFAAGRWLAYPAVLLVCCLVLVAGVVATRALHWFFIVIISTGSLSVTIAVIWLSALDWYDEYYLIDDEGQLIISYKTPLKYDTTRNGPISALQDVWCVRRGLWKIVFDYGDIYLQVGWSRRPFVLRDVSHPYSMKERIRQRALEFKSTISTHASAVSKTKMKYNEG